MIARRHVFYLAGFDPIDASAQHRRFRREARKFDGVWDVSIAVSEMEVGPGGVPDRWFVNARGPNWTTNTTVELLDWQDLVRAEIARPVASHLFHGLVTFGDIWVSGTAWRYFRAFWPYGVFFLVPFLNGFLFAAIGIALGFIVAQLVDINAAVTIAIVAVIACGVFALLMRWPGRRWRIRQAFADWIFARAFMYRRRQAMDARLDEFAQRLVERVRAGGCDEIVIVGHSLGATMALIVLSRALDTDPAFATGDPKVRLLTVGSTIAKIALHPAAGHLRDCAARVAAAPALAWTEYQARRDAISFYKFNPVTLDRFKDNVPGRKPHIRLVGIKDMMTLESYTRHWLHQMRLHYQFVMANERRAPYDFFMTICGPADFEKLSLAPNGAVDLFDGDGTFRGSLQEPALPAGASTSAQP
jgi:pimeloyl-ACP methyl ester carboxylesterase